jgi:hypothetical protein
MNHQRPTPPVIAPLIQKFGKLLSKLGLDVKRLYELTYWRWRYFREKELSHSWYQDLFTAIPELDK